MRQSMGSQKVRHDCATELNDVICCCSVIQSCLILETQWTAARQASLSFTIPQSLLKLMSVELVMPSDYLILCRPFLLMSNDYRC